MQINYEDFYKVSPEDAVALVDRLEHGEEVRSVRGDAVKTAREIAYETATAGTRIVMHVQDEGARTLGGESPPADATPGFRPKVEGEGADGDG